jgi:hypothetical protein
MDAMLKALDSLKRAHYIRYASVTPVTVRARRCLGLPSR